MSDAARNRAVRTWYAKGVTILKKILASLVAASFLMTGAAMAQAPANPAAMATKAPKKVKVHKPKAAKTTAPVATATP
jgi:hypothetical protein